MFIKTEDNDIVGVHQNSQIYWKEYNYEEGFYPRKGIKIVCDGMVLKRYKNRDSQKRNIENAKSDLLKIFEALKNNKETYEMCNSQY